MISNVTVKDNTNTPLSYLPNLDAFKNGTEYNFQPGINIIVGENGCGKSTLLKLISMYTLCSENMFSTLPDMRGFGRALKLIHLFNEEDNSLKDGVSVCCDYGGVVYNYILPDKIDKESSMNNLLFFLYGKNCSTGERSTYSMKCLFETAFANKEIQFPLKQIKEYKDTSNDIWSDRFGALLKYYRKNHLAIKPEEFEYTFLLDEPDRNLDVMNIRDLYGVLSHRKELTQLICIVHNPILIYLLSKLDYVNIIEMTDGYMAEIEKLIGIAKEK